MYKGRKIIGIIPARGGSKGLPRKNIRRLAGKPLIAWTIEKALSSALIDKVVVSTDDAEIAGIAREYGAQVPFMRPEAISGDKTPMIDVINHCLDFFAEQAVSFDYVSLLEPTSPLRKRDDIDSAVRMLIDREGEADSLVSAGEVHLEHPSIMKRIVNGFLTPFGEAGTVYRRQDLKAVYFPYGVIYMSRTGTLRESGTFYQERTIPYLIERWQNYEVDDLYDFICIEAILNHMKEESVS